MVKLLVVLHYEVEIYTNVFNSDIVKMNNDDLLAKQSLFRGNIMLTFRIGVCIGRSTKISLYMRKHVYFGSSTSFFALGL